MTRDELTDYELAAIRPSAEQGARRAPRDDRRASTASAGRSVRRTMARSAGRPWPTHHLLQPSRPVAKGRSVGADHGRTCRRS